MRGLGAALLVWAVVPLAPPVFFVLVLLNSRAAPSGFDYALSAVVVALPALLWLILTVSGLILLAGRTGGITPALWANRFLIAVLVLVAVYAQNAITFGCTAGVLVALVLNRLLRAKRPRPVETYTGGGDYDDPEAVRKRQLDAAAAWFYLRGRGR